MDGGRFVYLLGTGKLSSLKFPTFWFENAPQGKFILTIEFGQCPCGSVMKIRGGWKLRGGPTTQSKFGMENLYKTYNTGPI